MAKIVRFDGNVEAFGINALVDERTVFGDTLQSDTLDDNVNPNYLRGWGILGVNDLPTKQDFAGMGFTLGQLNAYLHQIGVAEWNINQEYHKDSIVNYNGILKVSMTDTNTGNEPLQGSQHWKTVYPRFNSPFITPKSGLDVNAFGGLFPSRKVHNVVSATFSGGFITYTLNEAHTLNVGEDVAVTGAVESEYNGTKPIESIPNPNEIRVVEAGTPTSPATGTIKLVGFESSFISVNEIQPDTLTLDPSGLAVGESRIDAIVILPEFTTTPVFDVIQGVASLDTPDIPLLLEGRTLVGLVRLYQGQTEILESDIITGFDQLSAHKNKANTFEASTLKLKRRTPGANVQFEIETTGVGTPRLILSRSGQTVGQIDHIDSTGIFRAYNAALGGTTVSPKELYIRDDGQLMFRRGYGDNLQEQIFTLYDQEFVTLGGTPLNVSGILPLTIREGEKWFIQLTSSIVTLSAASWMGAKMAISGAGAGAIVVTPADNLGTQYRIDSQSASSSYHTLAGFWLVEKATAGGGNGAVQINLAGNNTQIHNYSVMAFKGMI